MGVRPKADAHPCFQEWCHSGLDPESHHVQPWNTADEKASPHSRYRRESRCDKGFTM